MFEIYTGHLESTAREHLAQPSNGSVRWWGRHERLINWYLSWILTDAEQLIRPKKSAFQSLVTTGWSQTVFQQISENQTVLAKDSDPVYNSAETGLRSWRFKRQVYVDHGCDNPQEGWAVDQKEINNSRAWPVITGKSKDTEETNASWPNAEIKCTLTCFLARDLLLLMTWSEAKYLSRSPSIELGPQADATTSTGPAWLKPPGQGTTETKRPGSSEEGNTGTSPSLCGLMSEAVFWPSSDFHFSFLCGRNQSQHSWARASRRKPAIRSTWPRERAEQGLSCSLL